MYISVYKLGVFGCQSVSFYSPFFGSVSLTSYSLITLFVYLHKHVSVCKTYKLVLLLRLCISVLVFLPSNVVKYRNEFVYLSLRSLYALINCPLVSGHSKSNSLEMCNWNILWLLYITIKLFKYWKLEDQPFFYLNLKPCHRVSQNFCHHLQFSNIDKSSPLVKASPEYWSPPFSSYDLQQHKMASQIPKE